MSPHRSDYRNGVNVRRAKDFGGIRGCGHVWVCLARTGQCRGTLVNNELDPRRVQSVQIPDDVRSPVAVADYANSDHICPVLLKSLKGGPHSKTPQGDAGLARAPDLSVYALGRG